MKWQTVLSIALPAISATPHDSPNATYINPMIAGWASDPTCIHHDGTFFCALSTFIAFPGLPIYASKDLVNWKLISHAFNRPSQLPAGIVSNTENQQGGMYAPNLRIHSGVFHVTCTWLGSSGLLGTIFKTKNLYDNAAWSDPITWNASSIDPDLFFDSPTSGKAYLTSAGIIQQQIDLTTGAVTPPIRIWNGTGGASPEGPHIYKKDGYYYLMIAEGGTEPGHSETIARSRNISGPYTSNPSNPVLTNANTTEYFQTVGHADLFQDANGKWWSAALSTRSGPEWVIYPMGRESVLTAVTWEKGEWPVFSQVRGVENVWPLPPWNKDIPGKGAFNDEPDIVDFAPGSSLPSHFYSWRYPVPGTFTISPPNHPNTLRVTPLRANLTGAQQSNDTTLTGWAGLPFIGRRQTDSLFRFSVDVEVPHQQRNSAFEAGISVFLTQLDHIDLGIVTTTQHHNNDSSTASSSLILRQYSTPSPPAGTYIYKNYTSTTTSTPLPKSWSTLNNASPSKPTTTKLRLQVHTTNSTHYTFSASPAANPNAKIIVGYAPAERVSGRSGRFTGVLLGVYNTCDGLVGEDGEDESSCPEGGEVDFSRWRYVPVAQYVGGGEFGVEGGGGGEKGNEGRGGENG